ncbi:hypothetical protein DSO57_1035949 [Entomophthora muscae]|uniref:Uncharacterized protein n=1 Tax=Entomophthora muscae TaxID=34485 RepID=A0ACC2S1L4_9FUNG|nr:hypothetical protein DSO57_1035949 [Entomophthora muscae]
MSLPYLAIIEIGQLLDAKALLRLRLIDKHWNYLFTQLYFQNLVFKKPLDESDLTILKKYDAFINAIHIDRFDENINPLTKLSQHLNNLIEFSTSLPPNLHPKYMPGLSSMCKPLRQLRHLRIFRITAESPHQHWNFNQIHSLSLEMDGCWDILSFLENLSCPALKTLTIVHSKPTPSLASQAKDLFPALEEFHVLPYLEANCYSVSVNYKARSVSAVANHNGFVSFRTPQYEFKSGHKAEALVTLESHSEVFSEPKRIGHIRSLLPYIDTFHFGNFNSIPHLYEMFNILQTIPHLEFDWRIMPSLSEHITFQTKQLTFHSQCGLYAKDMEWFISCFPNLEVLQLTHCYGEKSWAGTLPKLNRLICLFASAAPLHHLLRTAPNCRTVEIAQTYYLSLHAEGFFKTYPMIHFKIHPKGIFESTPLFQ